MGSDYSPYRLELRRTRRLIGMQRRAFSIGIVVMLLRMPFRLQLLVTLTYRLSDWPLPQALTPTLVHRNSAVLCQIAYRFQIHLPRFRK